MTQMTSPQGEVLDIPAEGVRSMRALGWEVTEPEPEPTPPPPRRTSRRKSKEA